MADASAFGMGVASQEGGTGEENPSHGWDEAGHPMVRCVSEKFLEAGRCLWITYNAL